jgi:soluble lytic murein transglycosylase-like protein
MAGRARSIWLALALLAGLWASAPVRAEVWAYVDKRGVAHYADRQVDRRYELLYRGPSTGNRKSLGLAPGAGGFSARTHARFEVSTAYKSVRHLIREAATAHGLEYDLVKAVIATESGFNARAVSPKGAVGLMQLMPATAERFGVRPARHETLQERLTDPRTNVQAGTRYLAWLLKTFNGDVQLALAAYNAGEGAVIRAGRRIPNYRETQDYVRKVTLLRNTLQLPSSVIRSRPDASTSKPVPTVPRS